MNHLIKIFKCFSFGVLTLLVVFIVVNQFDESLDPEIQALIDKEYQFPEKTKNAYYALAGFYTANDADMVSKGEEIINAYLNSEKQYEFKYESVNGAADIGELDAIKSCTEHQKPKGSCLKEYAANKPKYKKQIKDHYLLLKRYKKLLTYPHYIETSTYIPFMLLTNQSLYLSEVGLNWLDGKKINAVSLLFDDIKFNRMVIRESTYLISQMIATAALYKDYALLTEFIRHCPSCVSNNKNTKIILSDLSDKELLLTRVLQREVQFAYFLIQEEKKKSKDSIFVQYMNAYYAMFTEDDERNRLLGILGYFTLENATFNMANNSNKKNIKLSKYKYADYNVMKEKFFPKKNISELKWYDYFYNPGGKLLAISMEEFSYFFGIYFDNKFILASKIRLIRLFLDIKNQDIAKNKIQIFLDQQSEANRDPYTGKSIVYDANNNSIFIKNSNKHKTEIYLQ